jgi:hypothetical protein
MKTKAIIIAALLGLGTLSGCQKDADDLRPACEVNNNGTISVRSYQSDSYLVELNGSNKGNIGPYGSLALENVNVGTHTVRVTQLNGWLLFPTVSPAR